MSKDKSVILEIHDKLNQNKISFVDLVNEYNKQTQKLINDKTNAVITDLQKSALEHAKKLDQLKKENKLYKYFLTGIPCTLKDNICVKNIKTTGGSIFLKDYIPSYSASVFESLKLNNVIINSKTNMDELGLGGTGTYSGFNQVVYNNIYKDRITGGSSSGSVLAVKNKSAVFAIATDTGDSIRRPCSFMGLVGYKPTYGLVSRYGVLPYAPSLDHVGIISNSITDTAIILDTIAFKDPKDHTSFKSDNQFYARIGWEYWSKLRIGVIKQLFELWPDCTEKQVFTKLINDLKNNKDVEIVEIDLDIDLIKSIPGIYQIISYSEAVSSWNNLSGLLFGNNKIKYDNWEDLINKTRQSDLSYELKKRFIFGNYATNSENFNKYYFKAKQLVDIFKNLFDELFNKNKIEVFILPGASSIAFKLADVLENKVSSNYVDDLLEIANFTGFPSITFPFTTVNKLPFGINLFANSKQDSLLLQKALKLYEMIDGEKYAK